MTVFALVATAALAAAPDPGATPSASSGASVSATLAVPAASATPSASSGAAGSAGPSATPSASSGDATPAGPSATLATSAASAAGEAGGTSFIESLAQIQVRRVYVPGSQQVGVTIPDGEARLLLENRFAGSVYRVGGHYNIVTGRIEASFTDAIPILADGTQLQLAVSDDIGLGPLYLKQHYIERTQSFPVGIGRSIGIGNLMVTAQRARWKQGELDPPAIAESGLIDSVGVQFSSADLIPDLAEAQLPEHQRSDDTIVKFHHAFRDLGGDYAYDKLESDLKLKLPGVRSVDRLLLRWQYGQAVNVAPSLPLRETFGLGGADALRGYLFEEFRGNGLAIFTGEYSVAMPWSLTLKKAKLFFQETDLLVFGDLGRIQDDWWRPTMPVKASAGIGVRCAGQIATSVRSQFRVYVAQAADWPAHKPMVYLLADVD